MEEAIVRAFFDIVFYLCIGSAIAGAFMWMLAKLLGGPGNDIDCPPPPPRTVDTPAFRKYMGL